MRKIIKEDIRNILLILILTSVILIIFHIFRFSSSSVLPIYDQYKYQDINLAIPFIIGIVNSFLIYLILINLAENLLERFYSALLIIISPVFIYVHCTQNSIYLGLMFILLGLLFLLRQKFLFSALFLLISFMFNQIFIFLILIILLIFLERTTNKSKVLFLLSIVLLVFVFSLVNNFNVLGVHSLITSYISDFGAIIGFGTFSIILFSIGLILSWKNKSKNVMIYFVLLGLCIMVLFNKDASIFLVLFIGFFGGKALYYLQTRKWASEVLKNYVILLLFCGLIFTSGSYIKRISVSGPYEEEINSLVWLSQQEPGKVLSNHEYGYLIRTISGFEPYTDKDYYLSSKNKERIIETNHIYQSRNLEKIIQFLKNNQISYIWITKEMKDDIWKTDDQGILLILENSRHFSRVYNYDVEIWKFNNLELN